jgi:tRNA(fMet)-specific endonuclease VapC
MELPRILIDTSIVIEHLRKQNRRKSILYRIADDYALYVSTIAEFELYAGAINSQKQHDVQEILGWCTLLPFTSDVAATAAALYRELKAANQLIEIRDIFIASTALTYTLPLMTLNLRHFDRIKRLHLLSPLT